MAWYNRIKADSCRCYMACSSLFALFDCVLPFSYIHLLQFVFFPSSNLAHVTRIHLFNVCLVKLDLVNHKFNASADLKHHVNIYLCAILATVSHQSSSTSKSYERKKYPFAQSFE